MVVPLSLLLTAVFEGAPPCAFSSGGACGVEVDDTGLRLMKGCDSAMTWNFK